MSAAPEEPTHSPKVKDSVWGGSTSSNLYLATFLATLFLLLFGSCCIVIRSYMLRRRFRRHIQEILSAEGLGGSSKRCRCRKRRPNFHDRWIAPAAGSSWGDIMPLSLRIVFGKCSSKHEDPKLEVKTETRKLGIKSWKSSGCANPAQQDHIDHASGTTKFEIAQVSVLIEMPSPERSTLYGHQSSHLKSIDENDDDENEMLPELVIGYARCHKHWWMDAITEVAHAQVEHNNTHHTQ